jgi:hypothetical protein
LVRVADAQPALEVLAVEASLREREEVVALETLELRDAPRLRAEEALQLGKPQQMGIEVGDDAIDRALGERAVGTELARIVRTELEEAELLLATRLREPGELAQEPSRPVSRGRSRGPCARAGASRDPAD